MASRLSKEKVSRRGYVKYAAAGVVVVAGAAAGAYYATREPTPTYIERPMQWIGQSFSVRPEILEQWNKDTGYTGEYTILDPYSTMQKILTGGADIYDITDSDSHYFMAIKKHKPPVIVPVPVKEIPRWTMETVCEQWTTPNDSNMGQNIPPPLGPTGDYIAKTVFFPCAWAEDPDQPYDDLTGTNWAHRDEFFAMPPQLWNYDSIGYNPKYVDIDENNNKCSWAKLYDPEYKGKAGLIDVPTVAYCHSSAYLTASQQIPKPEHGPNMLTPDDLERVTDFLIEKKKAGQFRVTWNDYMQIVTIHAAEDIIISDAWQPVVYDVRRAETPMRYAEVEEGYRCWYSGGSILNKGKEILPACYSFLDFHYAGWIAAWISGWGYHIPTYPSDEVKNYMGPEHWGWVYGGQRTYKALTQEEGPLFDPLAYEWSKEAGSPSSDGWRKDCGSIDERWSRVGSWTTWPKFSDDYMDYWEKFRTA